MVKEQAKANRKIYCIDNGFIATDAFRVSEGTGRLAENAVAVRLRKRELDGECEVFFWKNVQQHEVDFVVVKKRKVDQIIQVCWNIERPETKEREIRALVTAGEELKCKKLLILSENKQGMENVEWFGKKAVVQFMPLWQWMME
jgi:predicted AAA+ superfamily ATPase